MDHKSERNYRIANRIGFHYFPDSMHYREKDLNQWLPWLKRMNAGWLVLASPISRAIPEDFISALSKEKINTIIDFNHPLHQEVSWRDLEILLRSYGKWGANYVLLNQKPNSQKSWGVDFWNQPALVENHTRQFIQFANLALDCGLKPVFSPLVPGGDYWDISFLEGVLKILASSASSLVVNNTSLSAFAWDHDRPLDWGAGGPKVWPKVKPYQVPEDSQDQRGFRAFEWYSDSVNSLLGKNLPIILLQAGIPQDPARLSAKNVEADLEKQQQIYQLLNKENVYHSVSSPKLLNAIPANVQACAFFALSADDPAYRPYAWFSPTGTPLPPARAILNSIEKITEKSASITTGEVRAEKSGPQFQYGRYILVAESLKPRMQAILKELHAYITRFKPMIGFSCKEARKAAFILVLAYENDFPECEIEVLQSSGGLVQVIRPEDIQTLMNAA